MNKGLLIAIVGFSLLLAVQTLQNKWLKEERDQYKANLQAAITVNEANDKSLAFMKGQLEKLQTVLSDWKNGYESIDNNIRKINSNVYRLRTENENIRSILSTAIPCELWTQLFPSSAHCPDTNTNTTNTDSKNTTAPDK